VAFHCTNAEVVLVDVSRDEPQVVPADDPRRGFYQSTVAQARALLTSQHNSVFCSLEVQPSAALIGCLLGYPVIYMTGGDIERGMRQLTTNSLCGEELLHVAVSRANELGSGISGQIQCEGQNMGPIQDLPECGAMELAAKGDTLFSFTVPVSLFKHDPRVKVAVLAYMRALRNCAAETGIPLTTSCSSVTLDNVAL
jgi:hypothetical protein